MTHVNRMYHKIINDLQGVDNDLNKLERIQDSHRNRCCKDSSDSALPPLRCSQRLSVFVRLDALELSSTLLLSMLPLCTPLWPWCTTSSSSSSSTPPLHGRQR